MTFSCLGCSDTLLHFCVFYNSLPEVMVKPGPAALTCAVITPLAALGYCVRCTQAHCAGEVCDGVTETESF